MNLSRHGRRTDVYEDRSFLVVFLLVSLAFGWILSPILLAAAVVSLVYAQIQSGGINFDQYFHQFQHVLPGAGRRSLAHFGLTDIAAVCARHTTGLMGASKRSPGTCSASDRAKEEEKRRTILID